MNGRIVWSVGFAAALAIAPQAMAEDATEDVAAGSLEDRVDQLERALNGLRETKAGGAEDGNLAAQIAAIQEELEAYRALNLTDPWTLRAYWKDGLRLDTANKEVQFRIGGRINNDWAFFSEDDEVVAHTGDHSEQGTEFRRARLYMSALLFDHFELKAEYDFAGGREAGTSQGTDFKDVYMGLVKIPHVGGVRVGHFKEPFSLEELTSSNYITFMERSLPNAFAPSRNVGAMLHNSFLENRLFGALGIFRETDNFGDSTSRNGDYNITLRLCGTPMEKEDGRHLFHLGGAYSYRNPEDDAVDFDTRPEAHLAQTYVGTGPLDVRHYHLLGIESAYVLDSLSFQGEFVYVPATGTNGDPDREFYSLYVMASYFLTGEHRPYRGGVFGGVKPIENFLNGEGGLGAWELVARYSYIDLEDNTTDDAKMHDVTLGVNWHLTPNFRVMANYVFSHIESVGDGHIFMWRFQANW